MLPLPGGVPHLLELAGVAALIGGAAAIERKGAFQLMIARPLVLGPLLGWALGDAEGGLFIGLPLELIFLGGVNLGGSLPENETLLTAALVAVAVPAGQLAATGVDASLAALATIVLLPLAWAGRRLDRATEEWNSALADLAVERAAAGDPSAARVNLRGLLLPFGVTAGICFAVALLSPLLGWARLQSPPRVQLALVGAWHAVWALAAATAIRAIRDPKAPIVAALAAVTAIALGVAFQGVP